MALNLCSKTKMGRQQGLDGLGASFMPEEVADKGCRSAYQLDDGGMVGNCGRCNWLLGVDLRWSTGTTATPGRCRGAVFRGQRNRSAIEACVSNAPTDPRYGPREVEDDL